jgi:hypothetical protein
VSEQSTDDGQGPSFLTIVMMLSGSTVSYLEAAEDKSREAEKKQNLELARYIIDLLGVLEKKTAGNLTDEEKNGFETVLTQLRMMYVKVGG